MTSPKFNDVGLTVIVGVTPVPLNVTVLSAAPALLKVSVALYACAAVGEKVTDTVPPAAGSDEGVTLNAAAPVPLFVTVIFPVKLTPVTVIVCAVDVVPVFTLPKDREVGLTVMVGVKPVPLKVTGLFGELGSALVIVRVAL